MKKILISIVSIIIIFIIFSNISLAMNETFGTIGGRLEDVREASGYAETNEVLLLTRIAFIIRLIMGFLGIAFLILTIISGFQWMMSGGNEEIISKAKNRIKNSVIGLAIILLSYSISIFIFDLLIH
ncbi:MAG TPA: hypothetical protein PKL13_01000 [bacterium]|nr:hypothetical protein [bacterium]